MNCRRLIGLDNSVIAVLPSISSATAELAVKSASSRPTNEMVVRPVSLYILMSSPNVKYDTKIVAIRDDEAMNASTKNAGWRIASLAVASAMVRDFMARASRRMDRSDGWAAGPDRIGPGGWVHGSGSGSDGVPARQG